MLDWIKQKIESLKFLRHSMKIMSYTDVIRERCLDSIVGLRSKMYNMSNDDIEKAIKLMDHMGIEESQAALFVYFNEIKYVFGMMKYGSFNPGNSYGWFKDAYSQYQNMYSQSQYQGNPYNPYHTFGKFAYGSQYAQANSQNQYGQYNG